MKTGLNKKFLIRREKSGHRRGNSSDPTSKPRPRSSDSFFSLLKPDSAKASSSKEEGREEEKDSAKIEDVKHQLDELELTGVTTEEIRDALSSKHAAGDVQKAIDLLQLHETSRAGTILPYDPTVHMLGAENRGGVTCYLDALLFAMFANLGPFECMLKHDLPSEPQRRLAASLRLWVNMLRSGKLVPADMTEQIQDALAACGWEDAKRLKQQDTSEAFAFITETLQLPLLPLQVDLFHHGKNDDADHKVVYERLLNLAVPPDCEGREVKLEDCLEEYFNSQVDVLRDSLEEKKAGERNGIAPVSAPASPSVPKSTIRIVTEDGRKDPASPLKPGHGEMGPIERKCTASPGSESAASTEHIRLHRSQTDSIIQEVVLDDEGKPSDPNAISLYERAKKKVSVVKAVTIPAWQFFKLIPWYSAADSEPRNDSEVANHFKQRPVVGICLKRYVMDTKGQTKRQNTYIDIPDSFRLPQFIVDEENDLRAEYKLVLQSAVCHRGDSLHSGHYVGYGRIAPKLMTDNRRHDSDPPPDYEEPQWVRSDDLLTEARVKPVDDIKQAFRAEMPYLLFYQIVPIVDVTASSTNGTEADGTEAEPPSYNDSFYNDSRLNLELPGVSPLSQDRPAASRRGSNYFDNLPSASNSARFSAELEQPSRPSFTGDDGFLTASRRGSAGLPGYLCASPGSPGKTPEGPSPSATPAAMPEETTTHRLTRAAAKFRGGSKSRPPSQASEGRLSVTMSRLSGLVRNGREPLRDSLFLDPNGEFETANGNGTVVKDKDREKDEEKDKDKEKGGDKETTLGQKRRKSKGRLEKGKTKEAKGKLDVPDRECILQ